jgi:hypothetical protein
MDKTGWRLSEEDEWSRLYTSKKHPRIYESKFATGEATISLADLPSRWSAWDEGQRVQFARAFGSARALSSEDEQVLHFLVHQNDEMISTSIAMLVAELSDKERAARFLLDCLKAFRETRASFLMALGVLAALDTVPELSVVFQECSHNIRLDAQDYDSMADLLYSSEALYRITSQAKYLDVIRSYLHHPNDRVRFCADMAMRGATSSR